MPASAARPASSRPHATGWLLLALLLLLPTLGSARQLAFEREGPQLHYRWQPPAPVAAGKVQELTLSLPEQSELRVYRAWRPEAARRTLYTRLLRAARQQWPEVFFELRRQDPWQIAIRTPDPQQLPEVQKWLVQEESRQLSGLLDENFQREGKDPLGRTGIQPDYNRIIDISSSELGDVAEALLQAAGGEQTPPRDLFNYLLAFVQAIPYQQLQSEDGRRGSGFLLPQQVLSNNRGDCDSKVTLLASIWRYLQPEIPLVLLFVPDHALLGVALPAQGAEETLTVAGGRWLLAEPTGPAELSAGELSAPSRLYIQSRSYQAELVQAIDKNSTPNR